MGDPTIGGDMNRFAYLALLLPFLLPVRAHACGGFFCSTSPVDQSGESIVYGLESDGTLTMAVQIRYSGDDDDFAWILPVPAPPEISLGTDALFDNLDAATRPIFVRDERTAGQCREHPTCVYDDGSTAYTGGCGFGPSDPTPWMGGYVDAAAAPPPPPTASSDAGLREGGVTVFSQGSVGPYDTVVLGSSSAAEVVSWLGAHDYVVPQTAVPILESYEGTRQIFVALRLASNPTTRQIRPLVLRMPTAEACLPIRLTAIATVPEMPITAYFLGSTGVTSTNYSVAEVDATDLAFWEGTRSWRGAVTSAVDAMGGQAFVTDYAGPTPAVRLELPDVADLASESDPATLVQALRDRGYPGDAALLDIFSRHLVAPASYEGAPQSYYNCLTVDTTASCGEPSHYDPASLVAAIDTEIAAPRRDAQALVFRHGHLTRLFTTMSAEDMTIDPVFAEDEGVPDVSNVHHATLVTSCSDAYYGEDAPMHWELDGEITPVRTGSLADDEAYCARFGAHVDDGTRTSPPPRSGCLCGIVGGGSVQWGALVVVLALAVARRRRHK